MYISLWILIPWVVLCIVAMYIIKNLYNKNITYNNWFDKTYSKLIAVLSELRMLDNKQMFESDDEVGILWDNIKEIIGELKKLLQVEENKNE